MEKGIDKKTVLILGSTGMAGHLVYYYLKSNSKYNVVNVSYRNKLTEDSLIVDIKNHRDLEDLIESIKPDYVINCIGILIKGSFDVENAIYINSYFPHFLKKLSEKAGAKLIHISTDCVFSGKKGTYREDSYRDADDIYGRSKALGEINDPNHLTIRTSIIGPELKNNGEGLFHWFMSQHEISGYTNAIWGGVTTLELAKAIEYCIEHDVLSGTVHLTNGMGISKYDLLNLFKSIWNRFIVINKGAGKKTVDKSLLKSNSLKYDVSSYEVMLLELYDWMKVHRTLYSQYTY